MIQKGEIKIVLFEMVTNVISAFKVTWNKLAKNLGDYVTDWEILT